MKEELLTKKEVLWIFAVKDNNVQNHYEKYYGNHDGEPTAYTLCTITKNIICKMFNSRELLFALEDNMELRRIMKARRLSEELGERVGNFDERTNLNFYENLWSGFESLFCYVEIDDIDQNAPKEWEQWLDEYRVVMGK